MILSISSIPFCTTKGVILDLRLFEFKISNNRFKKKNRFNNVSINMQPLTNICM